MFFRGFPGFASHDHDFQEDTPSKSSEVENKEFYEILEVPQTASQDEIKKSYRKKVIKAHPDKGGDPEEFKKLQAAYEILSNPEKREIYDKYGIEGLRGDGGGGMDPFEHLFGGLFGGGRGGRAPQQQQAKVKPTVKDLNVTLEDVYLGKMKEVTFQRQRNCEECDGKGGKDAKKCGTCKGARVIEKVVQVAPGFISSARSACHTCKGEGVIFEKENTCKKCKGDKVLKDTKTLEVPIETGAPNEHAIPFHGEGNEVPGAMAGDFVVRLLIEKHKVFERKGADLYVNKKISLYEALTGYAFYIEHLDGKKILISTQAGEIITPGDKKQLPNMGMPFYKDSMSHGNLYVTFDVEFPKSGQLKNLENLKNVLPVPKNLVTNTDKTKCEILDDFDEDGVNTNPEGGKKRGKGGHGHHHHHHGHHGHDHDDEEEDGGDGMPRGQRVQCAQQ